MSLKRSIDRRNNMSPHSPAKTAKKLEEQSKASPQRKSPSQNQKNKAKQMLTSPAFQKLHCAVQKIFADALDINPGTFVFFVFCSFSCLIFLELQPIQPTPIELLTLNHAVACLFACLFVVSHSSATLRSRSHCVRGGISAPRWFKSSQQKIVQKNEFNRANPTIGTQSRSHYPHGIGLIFATHSSLQ